MMAERIRIVLVAPRIAANVGNVARTAQALGAALHIVGPLGFFWDEKKLPSELKRSSVGYFEGLAPIYHVDAQKFWDHASQEFPASQYCWATKNGKDLYTDVQFDQDVTLIFGNEEEGVDPSFWCKVEGLGPVQACRIPMRQVRCLNLATSVGIMSYEVLRQQGGKRGVEAMEQGEQTVYQRKAISTRCD